MEPSRPGPWVPRFSETHLTRALHIICFLAACLLTCVVTSRRASPPFRRSRSYRIGPPRLATANAAQDVGTFGSVALRYAAPTQSSLYAAMVIRRPGHPTVFHVDAMDPPRAHARPLHSRSRPRLSSENAAPSAALHSQRHRQTPFNDQLAFRWEGGMWQYDAYHDSIITAGNGGTQPIKARFTLFYNQGTKRYDMEQSLQPDQQMWVDVGQLIRMQTPDVNGNLLRSTLTSGSYEIADLTHHGTGTLFEGKVIYDKMYGHAAYGCALCCGYYHAILWYNPLGIPDGSTAPQGVEAQDGCNGGQYDDVSGSFYGSWSVNNPSIASADYYGTHTGISLGSTTSSTSGHLTSDNVHERCPLMGFTPSSPDNVNAVPVNFHQTSTSDNGNGDLHFVYAWSSSSGNLVDLSNCTIDQFVLYPGSSGMYFFPPPFPNDSAPNPTSEFVDATVGGLTDDNWLYPSTTFIKPYSSNSFTATQYWEYECTNVNNGALKTMVGPLAIVRTVGQNIDGTWKFTVTKPTNGLAKIDPLP